MNVSDLLRELYGNQPFFGGTTHGVQAPPSVEENLILTALVSCAAPSGRPIKVLEVGAWTGFSALTWAHAIGSLVRTGGTVTCIDTWAPYHTAADLERAEVIYRDMDRLARNGLAYDLFLHNIRCGPPGVTIEPLRGHSAEVLRSLPRESIDLIYIDASHMYEAVNADLDAAIPLIRQGGILCGDDLDLQIGEVSEAEARRNVGTDFVNEPGRPPYHPGVTLAVHERLGSISKHGRTWFVRKTDDKFIGFDPTQQGMMFIPPHWPASWQREARALLRPTR